MIILKLKVSYIFIISHDILIHFLSLISHQFLFSFLNDEFSEIDNSYNNYENFMKDIQRMIMNFIIEIFTL